MQVLQRRILDVIAGIVIAVGAWAHPVQVDFRARAGNLAKMRAQRFVVSPQVA
ncbi:hypothetical protein D3C87_1760690 [compost metagenome]